MWNALRELLCRADREAQNKYHRTQARQGRGWATLAMALTGAMLGGTAMFYPYALVALLLMWRVHVHNPILVMWFLVLYVFIGVVQGVWLGLSCGFATAFRARKEGHKAGVACWIGSLPYVSLVIWFGCAAAYNDPGAVRLAGWLCGLPLLWAGILLLSGARLLSRPTR